MRARRLLNYGILAVLLGSGRGPALAQGEEGRSAEALSRAGFLGAQVAPLDSAAAKEARIEPGTRGVLVRSVLPGSSGEAAGIQAGDVITSVDGEPVSGTDSFVALVGGRREGDTLRIRLVRDNQEKTIEARLRARERETSKDYEIEYGSVIGRKGRLRTLITRPKGDGPFPALFMIQGLGCFSVENPSGALAPYGRIIDAFTRAGFVTLRVEKPGCGDSEGGPCGDVDFPTELEGYRQGLRWLQNAPYVDRQRIVLLGHSMGGVMGPLLAAETPVRGVAVYGTVSKTWFEYVLENTRRQIELAGASASEADQVLRTEAHFQSLFLYGGKSLKEIADTSANLAQHVGQLSPDLTLIFGRNPEFFRQLNAINLPEAWGKVEANVLAIHGEADYVSAADDHEQIARIVNQAHPGRGQYVELADTDHGFALADTEQEAIRRTGPGEMNVAVLDLLLEWAKGLASTQSLQGAGGSNR